MGRKGKGTTMSLRAFHAMVGSIPVRNAWNRSIPRMQQQMQPQVPNVQHPQVPSVQHPQVPNVKHNDEGWFVVRSKGKPAPTSDPPAAPNANPPLTVRLNRFNKYEVHIDGPPSPDPPAAPIANPQPAAPMRLKEFKKKDPPQDVPPDRLCNLGLCNQRQFKSSIALQQHKDDCH